MEPNKDTELSKCLKDSGCSEKAPKSECQCKLLNQSELNGWLNGTDKDSDDDGTM